MTHDELLARLDNRIIDEESDTNNYLALRAVVELHKPNKYNLCEICRWYMNKHKYPCPTIQAIEKELM
jgi:hypothetical protein